MRCERKTILAQTARRNDGLRWIMRPSDEIHRKPGSCGFVCEIGRLKVVDPNTGRILGANKTEEIWAKSSYMMNGYYNNPESTKNVIDSDGKHEIVRYVIV